MVVEPLGEILLHLIRPPLVDLAWSVGPFLDPPEAEHIAELKIRYGEEIPVVLWNGRKIFKFRVDPEKLRRTLRGAGSRTRSR